MLVVNFQKQIVRIDFDSRGHLEQMTGDLKKTEKLPDFLRPFFWEYNWEKIDVSRHADTIMLRIMER